MVSNHRGTKYLTYVAKPGYDFLAPWVLQWRCATGEVIVTIATTTGAGAKRCHQGGDKFGDALSDLRCVGSSLCWWRRSGWNVDDWVVRSVDKLARG